MSLRLLWGGAVLCLAAYFVWIFVGAWRDEEIWTYPDYGQPSRWSKADKPFHYWFTMAFAALIVLILGWYGIRVLSQ